MIEGARRTQNLMHTALIPSENLSKNNFFGQLLPENCSCRLRQLISNGKRLLQSAAAKMIRENDSCTLRRLISHRNCFPFAAPSNFFRENSSCTLQRQFSGQKRLQIRTLNPACQLVMFLSTFGNNYQLIVLS